MGKAKDSQFWPGFVDEEKGVGRDRLGTWFVALPLTETQPGIFETILKPGWFPGMRPGWSVLAVEMVDGRPLYTVRSNRGTEAHFCMRRIGGQWLETGFCTSVTRLNGVTCWLHDHGDGAQPISRGKGRASRKGAAMVYPGDPLVPEGWELVGYIPGTPGGDTYFVRTPQGSIRSACMRRGKGNRFKRCTNAAGQATGRQTGACISHGGRNIGNGPDRMMNLLDPTYSSLLRETVRPAIVDPARQQLKTRIDLLRYGWYLFIGAIIDRREWLAKRQEAGDDPDRTVGISTILSTAQTIINGTAIQGDVQAAQFKNTAKIWAQQAYCIRLGRLLAEIAYEEGEMVGEQVARAIELAMVSRHLIANQGPKVYSGAPEKKAEADSRAIMQVEPPAIHAQSAEELELLGAMSSETKQLAYAYISEQLGDTMLSLYPLMGVLQDLLTAEELAGSNYTVRQKILHVLQVAQKSQLRIDRALDISFTPSQEDLIGRDIGAAIGDALQGLPPVVAQRILGTFLERKDEVELPKKGHEQRLGEKIIEVAG